MNYILFKNKMFDLICFSIDQVYALDPGFDRNNLSRWISKRLLIRLRQGWFTFPEFRSKPDYALYFANRMYRPSYISLHSALSFYGIIPEAVVQITSVTTLKTTSFSNSIGEYSYNTIKKELMFGYDVKSMPDGRALQIALPEKAMLDLLYIFPEYRSAKDMEELRLDEDFLHDQMNMDLFHEFLLHFRNKSLEKRVRKLYSTYGL